MSLQTLSLDTLKDFDFGKANVAFEHALRKIVRDIIDRPGDKSARKVILTTELTPQLEQDGDVVSASVGFLIEAKIPKWKTQPQPTNVTSRGQLLFQELAPDNPDQMTIDDAAVDNSPDVNEDLPPAV